MVLETEEPKSRLVWIDARSHTDFVSSAHAAPPTRRPSSAIPVSGPSMWRVR